jgi:hypothetical protein
MARLLPFLKMDTVLIISSWPTGLYDYVQYMQMQSICIVIAYADGKYMRMPHLCRCPAYGYVEPMLYSLFSRSDPKKLVPDLPQASGALRRRNTRCSHCCQLLFLLYVVFTPFPVTRRGGRYCRFAYFVCVVHFRKLLNTQKIGSHRNGHPVI